MSKIVYIGNAVGDENGQASGGEAGNQNGKELRTQPWYLNKKGWIVLRPKDSVVASKLAYDMKAACNNTNIGYDQKQRSTLFNVASKVGYDCSKVTTPCECDCSSLVLVCLWYSGIKVKDFYTGSEVKVLMDTGKFEKLTDAKYTEQSKFLKAGDILVTQTRGHTCIVLNDGDGVEPEPQPEPEPTPEPEYGYQIKVHGSVRVREGNGVLSKKICTVSNCRLPYLGQATESPYWYKTMVDGKEGYITSKPKYTEIVEVEL